jgi:hypothetical protein
MAEASGQDAAPRTLWMGDLAYWMDENFLVHLFAQTGEVRCFGCHTLLVVGVGAATLAANWRCRIHYLVKNHPRLVWPSPSTRSRVVCWGEAGGARSLG